MALNDDGGVPSPDYMSPDSPDYRDAPMSLVKALAIADSVSHRIDGTSQAFAILAEAIRENSQIISDIKTANAQFAFDSGKRLGEAYQRIKELSGPIPERVDSDILARCSECGHQSTLYVDDALALDGLKRAMKSKSVRLIWKLLGWAFLFGHISFAAIFSAVHHFWK